MTKYLLKRLLRGVFSIIIVVGIVMVLIYTCLDRKQIFAADPNYNHVKANDKEVYEMQQWEKYGYVDYVPYADFLKELLDNGKISQETYDAVSRVGDTPEKDKPETAKYIKQFEEEYNAKGYKVVRLKAITRGKNAYKDGGRPKLYAYKDIPVTTRLWEYMTGVFKIDNIHSVEGEIGERKLTFTLYDPIYGGEKFSPAIMGNGTLHKYLLYFDDEFPFIHQNLFSVNLGASYNIRQDIDVMNIMLDTQGSHKLSMVTYPTGLTEESADDLHSAKYVEGSLNPQDAVIIARYTDDYTNVSTNKGGLSRMGYSFSIGIISVMMAYLLGIPLGLVMALKKDKLIDKIGTFYIIFIIAVPSLAYIFLFKAIGRKFGLPDTFNMENPTWKMYILPVVSLALPSVANLMKWLRRYMIDQMNSDYVKFARSGGLSEGEIFRKHILKNAIIPVIHGIPGSVLGSLTGAIITERVYVVPGVGNLLTNSISAYDNGVIVGMTLFYATLSVVSIMLGDILMSLLDPRISFVSKER